MPKRVASIVLLVLIAGVVFGQSNSRSLAADEGPPIYEITEIEYSIVGRTTQWAVERSAEDLRQGKTFGSLDALEAFLAEQQQILTNVRPLAKAAVLYEIRPREGQLDAVVVYVNTKDTFNVLALPYFRYDSNSGLLLSIRARDYNFAGSLETLRLDLDFERDTDGDNEYSYDWRFTLPFQWRGYDWSWGLSQELGVSNGDVEGGASTSLGIALPIAERDYNLSYTQSYGYDSRRDRDEAVDEYNRHTLESTLSFGTTFNTGLFLPVVDEVRYSPSVFTSVPYWFGGPISFADRGVDVGLRHGFSAGRVDWIGNFREGAKFSVSNPITYDTFDDVVSSSVDYSVAGYLEADPFGFSGRLSGFYNFYDSTGAPNITDDAAGPIRGVLNDKMEGDVAFYWNTDVTLKVWTIGNFVEGQGSIFFDGGVVTTRDEPWDPTRDFKWGLGIEAIGFPLFARSLYVRISLGFDIRQVISAGELGGARKREIFIGLGHQY